MVGVLTVSRPPDEFESYYTLRDIVENVHDYNPRPGDRVLDVGAHKGWFTMYCIARRASVRAYEPDTGNFRVLAAIDNPNITAIQAAVWSSAGTRTFYPSVDNPGNGSFIPFEGRESYPVDTVTFADAVNGEVWDCCKIDVEGSEHEIITSAADDDFRRIKYLTLEIHNNVYSQQQHDEMLDRLRQFFHLRGVAESPGRFNYLYCDPIH